MSAPPLARPEARYADWLDATYAVSTLEAGPLEQVGGRGLAEWRAERAARTAELARLLPAIDRRALGAEDQRALAVMERTLADAPLAPAAETPGDSAARCNAAGSLGLTMAELSPALYACFEALGNRLEFEGRTIVRTTALELLQELEEPARRERLFAALAPLFRSINGDGGPASPYRRLLRQAAAAAAAPRASATGSDPVGDAARTVGSTPEAVERMLVAVLEAWRAANRGPALEPWDYWHHYAAGVHALDELTPAADIGSLSARYYHDLGADLGQLGVLHDLAVRPGKAPLAYTDFVRIGRMVGGKWRPAIARVSANVEHGGLFVLNEIVHEDGHAVHMEAVRTRPAFFALGDDLFVEAFADVTSWSVADPEWQRRYLGTSVAQRQGVGALFANVMLDVAWGLFELRMLHAPESDPNAVWTDITARYLDVVPHPQLAWWALRVQLVDKPGYMINYGLGAILTAELRARLREVAG
ncbi:MAG: hypothetical protein JO173_02275, partial [Gammaproteobacteria bacterium]|nr:hypothetical protein [Gammaproteobacteria bacterium]